MARTEPPKHGETVRFTKIPPGSYVTAGVAYRVDRRVDRRGDKGDFRFENVESGSATIDRPWAVAMSVWEVA